MTRDDTATRDIPRNCICTWHYSQPVNQHSTRPPRWVRTHWVRGCPWHIDEGRRP